MADPRLTSIEEYPPITSLTSLESGTPFPQKHETASWYGMITSSNQPTAAVEVVDLLVLDASINSVRCPRRALVDGGASCNFIDRQFAERVGIDLWEMPRHLKVSTAASGNTVTCTHIIHDALIQLSGYNGLHSFVVMPNLDGFDVILGRAFLKTSRAVVSHHSSTITWPEVAEDINQQHATPAKLLTANPWSPLELQDVEHETHHDSENVVQDVEHETHHDSENVVRDAAEVVQSVGQQKRARSSTKSKQWPPPRPAMNIKSHATGIETPFTDDALAALRRVRERVAVYEQRMSRHVGKLPPSRGEFDHKIELKDSNSKPVQGRAIPLNAAERAQLAVDIRQLEEAGLIRRSESEWASPAFYVSKDGGKARRLVIDYRGLNKLLKQNAMSLPHIDELLARLGKAKYFTKLDCKHSYHQLLVREADRKLTAFITPLGHFEWCVMPFGERNAPASFVQMMRHLVLTDMTSRCILDFVDDLLVASETLEEHVKDVSGVLDRLEKHQLFIEPKKCQWMVQEVEFLGYKISATEHGTTIEPMQSKVEAVTEWPEPRTQTQMRSFLGFANTFRGFVDGFSRVAGPLFDLLKRLPRKTSPLRWNDDARRAFVELKGAIAKSATLTVADDSKPFFVHTDASDYAVGAVLSQLDEHGDLRPVGFVSEKLTDVQYRWSVYDKELYSVVVALKRWRMHLMYARHPVQIVNDHASLRFLMDQPRLTAKQTRWMALFSTFGDLEFVHVKGSDNTRADALSRRCDHDVGSAERQMIRSDIAKQQFAEVFGKLGLPSARVNIMIVESHAGSTEITTAVVDGYAKDERCKKIMKDPQRYGYRVRWNMLERIEDGSILVPDIRDIKTHILRSIHDAPTSGHLGVAKTYDRLAASYHWLNQWIDVADYVRSCVVCQQAKQRSGRTPGLHQPIEIVPKAHTIALDFLGPLNRTARGKNSIAVILDSFTKRVFLEAVNTNITAEQTADIIINRVVRHQGLPRAIRSDRDSRFTSGVWSAIWARLGSKVQLTTAHHHQANGLPERFMLTLLGALRSYTNDRGTDWDLYLPAIELSYNSATHASTGISPIELDIGITARLPLNLTRPENEAVATDSIEILNRINMNEIKAFRSLLASQERDKSRVDRSRRDEKYSIGEFAWLDTTELRSMALPGGKKLRSRWAGPFEIIDVDGKLNVRLDVPVDWQIHPVIHVSRLKRAHLRDEDRFVDDDRILSADELNNESHDSASSSENLGMYDVRGAAVAQVERDDVNIARPVTRSAVQKAHDRGERHDYLELRDRWDERREEQHRVVAMSQRDQ